MALSKITNLSILDDTIVNADVNSSAAIAKTKLASLDVVNADVNASAAIAMSKLATDPTNASNLASGTVPTARLGTGTASSSVFLAGDNSWAAAGAKIGQVLQTTQGTYTSSDLPPFRFESFGDNKRRCQRYYETSFIDGQIPGTSVSGGNSGLNTSWADGNCPLPGGGKFKVSKRATPTVVLYARGSTTTGQLTSSGTARTAVATQIGTEGVEYCAITSGTASAYSGGSWTASAELT